MNTKQKITLYGTAVMLCLFILFPPFIITGGYGNVIESRHSFILDAPKRKSLIGSIDAGTLAVQLIGVLAIGGLFYHVSRD